MKILFSCTKPCLFFASRVVYEHPQGKLTQAQKDFIDKFEDADTFSRTNLMNCRFLGEGISAKAFFSPYHNSRKKTLNRKIEELSQKMYNLYRYGGYAYSIYDDIDNLFYT